MSSPSKRSPKRAATTEMKPGGAAPSTVTGKSNQVRVLEQFLAHVADTNDELSERWGKTWADVPHKELADYEIWGHLATILVEIYTIPVGNKNAGQLYDLKTAHGIRS
jgi:hypothetical protein